MTIQVNNAVNGQFPPVSDANAHSRVWQILVFQVAGGALIEDAATSTTIAATVANTPLWLPITPPGQVGSIDPTLFKSSAACQVTYFLTPIA